MHFRQLYGIGFRARSDAAIDSLAEEKLFALVAGKSHHFNAVAWLKCILLLA